MTIVGIKKNMRGFMAGARVQRAISVALLAMMMFVALASMASVANAQDPSNSKPFVTDEDMARARGEHPDQQPPPPKAKEPALNQGQGGAIMFWLFAFITVAGSIFVITRRNLITAVMGMVGSFFGIAAVYAMLYAQFLTVIQVLVYAGAIMVLFVFVIMILNKPEAEPWSTTNLPGKIAIGLLLLYLFVRLVMVLWSIDVAPDTMKVPEPVKLFTTEGIQDVKFGSTRALGGTLFREYLFPFEAVSLVLLIAVVGAIAVARPHEAQPTVLADESDDSTAETARS